MNLKIDFDYLSWAAANALATKLAGFTVPDPSSNEAKKIHVPNFFEAAGIPLDLAAWDPLSVWEKSLGPEKLHDLSTLLGMRTQEHQATNEKVWLNLADANHGGTGPHIGFTGKTGYGKSHILCHCILYHAALTSPYLAAYALMDFKGGIMFKLYEYLPNVVMNISNLAEEPDEVNRAFYLLEGEIDYRERLIFNAGVPDSYSYRELWVKNREKMEPLPELFLIIDEYATFFKQNPHYIQLLANAGMRGRAFGFHVIPATQTLDPSTLGDLGKNLTAGVALTCAAGESRTVLNGHDTASHLNKFEAAFWAESEKNTKNEVRTFYATNHTVPYIPQKKSHVTSDDAVTLVQTFTKKDKELITNNDEAASDNVTYLPDGRVLTQERALMQKLSTIDFPKKNLWSPSLRVPRTLDDILPIDSSNAAALAHIPDWKTLSKSTQFPETTIPIGTVDDPLWQSQFPLLFEAKNTFFTGDPRSGRSTALHTVAIQLANNYSPEQVSIFAIDCGGTGLMPLKNLPHVQYSSMLDQRLFHRFIGELNRILNYRTEEITKKMYQGIGEYLLAKIEKPDPVDPYGKIYVLLDNLHEWWNQNSEEVQNTLHTLLSFGAQRGIIIIASTDIVRWVKIDKFFTQKFYFQCSVESTMASLDLTRDKKDAITILPADQPGRTFDPHSVWKHKEALNYPNYIQPKYLPAQIALPHRGNIAFTEIVQADKIKIQYEYREDYPQEREEEIARITQKWITVPAPPKLFKVEHGITEEFLREKYTFQSEDIPLGFDMQSTEPLLWDWDHLFISGGVQSGKTSTIRTILNGIVRSQWLEKPHIVIMTTKPSELAVEQEFLRNQGFDCTYIYRLGDVKKLQSKLEEIKQRVTGEEKENETAEEIMLKNTFSGKKYFFIIDGGNIFTPRNDTTGNFLKLVEYLRSPIGVRVIVTIPAEILATNPWTILAGTAQTLILPGPTTVPTGIEREKFKAALAGSGELFTPGVSKPHVIQVAYTPPWTKE